MHLLGDQLLSSAEQAEEGRSLCSGMEAERGTPDREEAGRGLSVGACRTTRCISLSEISSSECACSSETRTWDLPVAGLAEGVYTLRASAHDVAGNVKTTSSTFVVDLTRPTIAIDAPLDGAEFNGEVIVEISGADEIGLARLVANLYDERRIALECSV